MAFIAMIENKTVEMTPLLEKKKYGGRSEIFAFVFFFYLEFDGTVVPQMEKNCWIEVKEGMAERKR
jgi:hypothetical protein